MAQCASGQRKTQMSQMSQISETSEISDKETDEPCELCGRPGQSERPERSTVPDRRLQSIKKRPGWVTLPECKLVDVRMYTDNESAQLYAGKSEYDAVARKWKPCRSWYPMYYRLKHMEELGDFRNVRHNDGRYTFQQYEYNPTQRGLQMQLLGVTPGPNFDGTSPGVVLMASLFCDGLLVHTDYAEALLRYIRDKRLTVPGVDVTSPRLTQLTHFDADHQVASVGTWMWQGHQTSRQ